MATAFSMLAFWPVYLFIFKALAEQLVLSPTHQTDPFIENILLNINVPQGLPGLAIASPSRDQPDYYFHWIRDGALTMSAILNASGDPGEEHLFGIFDQYIASSIQLQQVPNLSGGVGEPKFYVDGTAFNKPWGRPQTDGPALRSLVTSKYARLWSASRLQELYESFIKTDIDYIVDVWQRPSFDLWEELLGYHFFTSVSHYGALRAVSALTRRAGLVEEADHYAKVSKDVVTFIEDHFLSCSDYICEHMPQNLGGRSSLDVASVLAVLELRDLAAWTEEDDTQLGPLFLHVDNPLLSKTVEALILDFMHRFPINFGQPGGIGRYPEDVYDGNGRSLGNPWFIATAAVAEYLILTDQRQRAGLQVHFIDQHRGVTLSEQINRYTGFMQGAANLTWSYSAVRRMELLL